ncbi:hypothetical protein E2C01_077368 [Portunus trituberculatus]|uniref:Uncharacterized protein n=1 Tax=Portunus trituberculatus TaxID=210409 RepID=A0A5B7IPI7_PORTR|nr:hypothetical protein [Portunus trituberculatus]
MRDNSSDTKLPPPPRSPQRLSTSSMNTTEGAACWARMNTWLNNFSVSPTYFDSRNNSSKTDRKGRGPAKGKKKES